jgi:hypothetical protein
MKPWKVTMPKVFDWHHFDEDSDPDPHQIEKPYPNPVSES